MRQARLRENYTQSLMGNNTTSVTIPDVPQHFNLLIYTVIVFAVFICGLLRALFTFFSMLASSRHMHNDMFASVVRSRMIFFDTNPIGKSGVIYRLFHFSVTTDKLTRQRRQVDR